MSQDQRNTITEDVKFLAYLENLDEFEVALRLALKK